MKNVKTILQGLIALTFLISFAAMIFCLYYYIWDSSMNKIDKIMFTSILTSGISIATITLTQEQ